MVSIHLPIRFGKSRKRRRPEEQDEEETYGFTVDVVRAPGSDSQQTADVVPVLALFNASSSCSWISQKFANRLGITEYEKSVKLTWKCAAISKSIQRTVFRIAPLADFDLLFTEQKEDSRRRSDPNHLDQGIQKAALDKLFEKGKMLLVGPAPPDPNDALTLAQLSAQLSHDSRRQQKSKENNTASLKDVLGIRYRAMWSWNASKKRSGNLQRITQYEKFSPQQIADTTILTGLDDAHHPTKRSKKSQAPSSSANTASISKVSADDQGLIRASRSTNSFATQRRQGRANDGDIEPTNLPYFYRSCPSGSVSDGSTSSDLSDPNYWILDETNQRYYHLDKETNEKWWYEAPP